MNGCAPFVMTTLRTKNMSSIRAARITHREDDSTRYYNRTRTWSCWWTRRTKKMRQNLVCTWNRSKNLGKSYSNSVSTVAFWGTLCWIHFSNTLSIHFGEFLSKAGSADKSVTGNHTSTYCNKCTCIRLQFTSSSSRGYLSFPTHLLQCGVCENHYQHTNFQFSTQNLTQFYNSIITLIRKFCVELTQLNSASHYRISIYFL